MAKETPVRTSPNGSPDEGRTPLRRKDGLTALKGRAFLSRESRGQRLQPCDSNGCNLDQLGPEFLSVPTLYLGSGLACFLSQDR